MQVLSDSDTKKRPDKSAELLHQNGDAENLHTWKQWVPMDTSLYNSIRLINICMLQAVDEMLNEHDIPYWLCGGTLLGAIRHQGFIPHDDDSDIECFEEHVDKLSAIPTNPPLFMGFVHRNTQNWNGHKTGTLEFFDGQFYVDVFLRPNDLPEKVHFLSQQEVFPLKRYKFHNIQLWGPALPHTYLDRCYGKDWSDCVCVWNHDFNWYFGPGHDARKVVLSLKDYNRIVHEAGVVSPKAESTATATYQAVCQRHGKLEEFYQDIKKYRFQRMFRRNKDAAEWRESQQQTT